MRKKPTPAPRLETRSVRPVHTDFQTREAGDAYIISGRFGLRLSV